MLDRGTFGGGGCGRWRAMRPKQRTSIPAPAQGACPCAHAVRFPLQTVQTEFDAVSDHRHRFLQLALRADALRFGEFTLKSGRSSPYFFNAGRFDSGAALAALAQCYADAVDAAALDFDLLFGPAYKGIPLGHRAGLRIRAAAARDLPLAFNRKEAKAHGEGGSPDRRAACRAQGADRGRRDHRRHRHPRSAGDHPRGWRHRRPGIVIALDPAGTRARGCRPNPRRRRWRPSTPSRWSRWPRWTTCWRIAGEDAGLAAHRDALLAYRARYGVA